MLSTACALARVLPLNVQFCGNLKFTVLSKHPVYSENRVSLASAQVFWQKQWSLPIAWNASFDYMPYIFFFVKQ